MESKQLFSEGCDLPRVTQLRIPAGPLSLKVFVLSPFSFIKHEAFTGLLLSKSTHVLSFNLRRVSSAPFRRGGNGGTERLRGLVEGQTTNQWL